MSQQLSCYHGHRFEVPQHAGEFALCPLCGALTRYRLGIGDTKGHEAHNQTLNQPHIPPLETSHDESAGKTLEIDEPHFIDQTHLQTGVFEQAAVHGGQKTPPDLEGAPEEVDDAPLSDVTRPDSSFLTPG